MKSIVSIDPNGRENGNQLSKRLISLTLDVFWIKCLIPRPILLRDSSFVSSTIRGTETIGSDARK